MGRLSAIKVQLQLECIVSGGFGGSLRSAVNGIQFVPPSSPPQVLGHVNYDEDCSHYECDKGPCRCTHQLKLTKDNLVQLTLISTVTRKC